MLSGYVYLVVWVMLSGRLGMPPSERLSLERPRLHWVSGRSTPWSLPPSRTLAKFQSTTGSVDYDRVELLEAALERVGSGDSSARARLLAHLAVDRSYDGEPLRRRELMEQALSMARRLGDLATLLDVLVRRIGIWMTDDIEHRLVESSEAVAIAEQLKDPVARFWAWFYRSIVAAEAGDRAELDRCRRRFPAESQTVGQPTLLWVAAYAQSWQDTLDGDLDAAEARATEALELGSNTGQPDVLPLYGAQLLIVRWHQGRDAEVVEAVEQMADTTPDIDSFRAALARIYADLDRSDEARSLLSTEAGLGFTHPIDPLVVTTMVMWAEAAVQVRDVGSAKLLIDRLHHFPDQMVCNGVTAFGALAHYRGALYALSGEFGVAERLLLEGLVLHEQLAAPFFEARSCLELARTLRTRGSPKDRQRVQTYAGRALALAQRHGYSVVESRAMTLAEL